MISIVSARLRLRPIRSPMWPNTTPADRPHDKPDRERRERQQRADQRTGVGEEHLVEHQAGRGGVEEEVVPLDGGAQQARRDDDAQPPAPLRVGFVGHVDPVARASGRVMP